MSFEDEIKTNPYNLLDALLEQPQLFYEWSNKASKAGTQTTRAKDRLDLIKADVDLRIRRNPKRYGLPDGKPPEGAIKATVLKDKKVKRYTKQYYDYLDTEKTLTNAMKSFQQRKNMLEALTTLNIQLHFAEPKVSGMQRGEISNRQTRDDIKASLKRKTITRRKK